MKTKIVILEILDDEDDREWWDAIGFPAPWLINEPPSGEKRTSFVKIVMEKEVIR